MKSIWDYGVQAPYTLSCLESMSYGGAMLPYEWCLVARSALTPELFLLWEAEFSNNCKELAGTDKQYLLQLSGLEPYHNIDTQLLVPMPILSNTAQAALKAWRSLPRKDGPSEPLARIQQGPDEPYRQFIARLLEAVERISGFPSTDTDNPLGNS